MSDWSIQRVEQLAPDPASFKTAQGSAKPAKWTNLGRDARLVWGECQGSGSTPYQVRVDLVDVTYKCSCPSRKLPCKHTLALLLMLASGAVKEGTPPEFVNEWSANRARRAEAKQAKAAAADKEVDKEAHKVALAKRIEKRETRIGDGLAQLETWLADIVADGLAATRAQGDAFWEKMAARLVDAQAPGLARRVRELSGAAASREWQTELLAGMARLQLLIDGYRALDRLPAPLAAEVRSLIGWTQDQEQLRQREGVRDHWHVIARRQFQDETLTTQTTWLHGTNTRQFALVLEFAVGAQPLPLTYSVGQVLDATLTFFDGEPAMRALEKARHGSEPRRVELPEGADVAAMQSAFATLLARNPYLERLPFVLTGVRPVLAAEGHLLLRDEAGRTVPVAASCKHEWELMALSGGRALRLFGEWNGRSFDPYCVQSEAELFILARLEDTPLLSKVA
jgi:hypothetical protein